MESMPKDRAAQRTLSQKLPQIFQTPPKTWSQKPMPETQKEQEITHCKHCVGYMKVWRKHPSSVKEDSDTHASTLDHKLLHTGSKAFFTRYVGHASHKSFHAKTEVHQASLGRIPLFMAKLAAQELKEHLLALFSISTHFALLLKTHFNAITPFLPPSYKSHGGGVGGNKQMILTTQSLGSGQLLSINFLVSFSSCADQPSRNTLSISWPFLPLPLPLAGSAAPIRGIKSGWSHAKFNKLISILCKCLEVNSPYSRLPLQQKGQAGNH